MKNIPHHDEEFIAKMRSEITFAGMKKIATNNVLREREARKIIETIPNHLKNCLVHDNLNEWNPTYILLYKYFEQELVNPDNHDFPYEPSLEYKRFKKDTVGYYLCRYLYILGFKYSTWMSEVKLELPIKANRHMALT
jgi:hypothetical protein